MPLPKPREDESKKDFIVRCMGNEEMRKEFPEVDQRFAVCNDTWGEHSNQHVS